MIIAAMAVTVMATAQNVEWTGPFGQPYVSVNGGGISSLNVETFGDFIRGVHPTAALELGTYFTPVWGASLEAQADLGTNGSCTFVDQSSLLLNGKVNLSNLLGGYKGQPRRVEVVLVPGIGWGHDYGTPIIAPNYVVYNTSAELNVNLGTSRAWQLNVRPGVIWKNYDDCPKFEQKDAYARLALGVTYKFKNRRTKSHNFKTNNYAVSQADYDALLAKYNDLANREPEVKEVEVVKYDKEIVKDTVEVEIPSSAVIYFDLGEYTISERELARLDFFAKSLDREKVTVKVTGSADTKTGGEARNNFLAEKRAEAVKNVLIEKYGFKPENIATEVVLDIFEAPESSRVVVIE